METVYLRLSEQTRREELGENHVKMPFPSCQTRRHKPVTHSKVDCPSHIRINHEELGEMHGFNPPNSRPNVRRHEPSPAPKVDRLSLDLRLSASIRCNATHRTLSECWSHMSSPVVRLQSEKLHKAVLRSGSNATPSDENATSLSSTAA